MTETKELWGVLGQFKNAESLSAAVQHLRDDETVSLEAFTPYPVDQVNDSMQFKSSPMPLILLLGGIAGGTSMYALEYWINIYAYPLNIGGRPLHSWPSFVPPTFEFTVLIASLAGAIGLVLVCRLPKLHHPVFEVDAFKRASTDGFFLAVKPKSSEVDAEMLRRSLQEVNAFACWEIPNV